MNRNAFIPCISHNQFNVLINSGHHLRLKTTAARTRRLPPKSSKTNLSSTNSRLFQKQGSFSFPSYPCKSVSNLKMSVTGDIYKSQDPTDPVVTLFTKHDCTLCDKVKDVLSSVARDYPHTLKAVDITDDNNTMWWDMYKYDIPVLHLNDVYWTKHRLTKEQAVEFLILCKKQGNIEKQIGQPNASKYEK